MAEPVRKCAHCRLRVQGVRQLDDGLSYCAKCITQMGLEERPRELAREDANPDRKPTPEEPIVTTTASSDKPATSARAKDAKAAAAQTPQKAPPAAPLANGLGTIPGPDGGDALGAALAAERSSLQAQRVELLTELQRIEGDINAIDARVEHVDALMETEVAS